MKNDLQDKDMDGLFLIEKPSNFQTKAIVERLWAKNPIKNGGKDTDSKGKIKKSLLDHMIETGITANCLLHGIYAPLLRRLSKLTKIDEKELLKKIVFICAMHDIGKVHPLFQEQDMEVEASLEAAGLSQIPFERIRHEKYSEKLLPILCKKEADSKNLEAIGQIVGLHHQKESHDEKFVDIDRENNLVVRWRGIQRYIYNFIKDIFPFDNLDILGEGKKHLFVIQNGILGVLVTADWIASSEDVFKETKSFRDFADITDFIEDRKMWISLFLSENNLTKSEIPEVKDFNSLFGFEGRPVQKDVEKIVKKEDVKVMLIESGCGSGKTEAALYAAAVLGNRYGLSGMYMGLPTGVTAAALQGRFENFLTEKLKISDIKKAKLMTSQAFLLQEHEDDGNEEEIKPEWTDYSRQRLLYPYAIGTVDQVMTVARLVRFESIRMAGLSSKVLIIDEIHAYDVYMMTVIERLIQICGELGIPVIMLSATLPISTKKALFSTAAGKEVAVNPGYPMISYVTQDGEFHEHISKSHKEDRDVRCELLPILNDEKEIAKEAVKNIESGGCECIIMNTVKSAVKVYDEVKELVKEDCLVILYHAKMTMNSRERKSQEILNLFGKDRKNRPEKAIVIGTQVLEQSLDVDFDYMMSAICPVDLLLQRVGRYHRHSDDGTIRENKNFESCVQVLIPEDGEDYKGTGCIYEKCFLDATVEEINNRKSFVIPSCIPSVVNAVYSKISDDKEVRDMIDASRSDTGNINIHTGFDVWINRNKLSDGNLMVRVKKGGLTEQIAILSEDEIKELGHDRKKDTELFKEKVVSVRSRDIEGFEKAGSASGIFKHVKIYMTENCVSADGSREMMIDNEYGFRIKEV